MKNPCLLLHIQLTQSEKEDGGICRAPGHGSIGWGELQKHKAGMCINWIYRFTVSNPNHIQSVSRRLVSGENTAPSANRFRKSTELLFRRIVRGADGDAPTVMIAVTSQ